jgi:hypothetical protein
MKLVSRLVGRRSPRLGLLSDTAMVAAAAFRVAKKPADGSSSRRPGPVKWLLMTGAALRLLGRVRRVRRQRRSTAGA